MTVGSTRTIAIANNALASSGTVVKSIEIAAALVRAGIPAELWVTRHGGPLTARVPPEVPVIETGHAAAVAGLGPALALARTIRRRRPAVLLSAGKHFHLRARLGLLLSGRRRITAFGGRASNSPERPGRGRLHRGVARLLYARKYADMDFVIAVSPALANELEALLDGRGPEILAIPNGVDVARIRRMAQDGAPHPWIGTAPGRVITTMGRVDVQKGVDVLLRAFANLADPAVRLIVIGPGESDYLAELRRLATNLGIADQVDFTGYDPNPFPTIAASDLFVLASRWEGASNALLEALATDVPIVATDCPTGNRDILADGGLGELAPVEDAVALAHAMSRELARTRPSGERREVLRAFKLETCLERYVSTLRARRNAVLDARAVHGRS